MKLWKIQEPSCKRYYGLSGDDTIYAGAGNDLLDGGAGNDTLFGGIGNDVFVWGTGAGNDTIGSASGGLDWLKTLVQIIGEDIPVTRKNWLWDWNGLQKWEQSPIGFCQHVGRHACDQDTVQFVEGLTVDDLDYLVNGRDLVLKNKETGETLTLTGWFREKVHQVQTFKFADGSTYTAAQIDSRAVTSGTAGDDSLRGFDGRNNTIKGLAGNDVIRGANGNDILDGGAGNDTLYGGNGNDTFLWGAGGGSDTLHIFRRNRPARFASSLIGDISSQNLTTDRYSQIIVQFGEGLTADDLDYVVNGRDLVIKNKETGETLTLADWFKGTRYQAQTFKFADGSTYTAAQIDSRAVAYGTTGDDVLKGLSSRDDKIYSLAGNDVIRGGIGNDLLDGGAGNDTLYGGAGNDTFVWGQGGGNDKIYAGNGAKTQDTLQFQNLVMASIEFTRSHNDLVCTLTQTGETVTISKWYLGTNNQIDQFQFTDGSLTAADVNIKAG